MNNCMYLAWQYIRYNKWQTVILFFCIFVTICMPLSMRTLIQHYQNDLRQRSQDTPLILGVRGYRFDLAMNALYFRTDFQQYCTMEDFESAQQSGLARIYPVFARHTCSKIPIAGVTNDYFGYRNLTPAAGTFPLMLGDAVLGANAAKLLDKGAGDTILSDQINLYSLAAQYPLKMNVAGVLSPTGSADDDVIFVDLKTAWIIEGLAHGHDDLADDDQQQSILKVEKNNIIGNANVTTYVEITDDNIAGFHLHGDQKNLPLTSIICVPYDNKSATILKGRHTLSKDRQVLAPTSVIDELLRIVFKIEVLLHTSLTIVAVAIAMLLGLIVLLSIRLRKREFDTLHAIGCSRKTVAGMVLAEWCVIVISSLLASGLFIILSLRLVPNISYLL